jgi:hypothetical protein
MLSFIDTHREELGMMPIWRELALPPPPTTNTPRALPTRSHARRVPGVTAGRASFPSGSMRPKH